MKTPSQTSEYLKQREDKEAIKALKERERHLQQVEKELSDILDRAITEGKFTEKGGKIEYYNFYRVDSKEGLADIKEIFRQAGWDCQYHPQIDSCYSMTSKSSSEIATHLFYLSPLGSNQPEEPFSERKVSSDRMVKPLSVRKKEALEERIKKRTAKFRTTPVFDKDYFTPIKSRV